MSSQIDLNNLDILFQAPNGIKLLRQFILKNAVSGKLVNQDPAEGSGFELVTKIFESRCIKIGAENKPDSDVPQNWGRAKLGEIFHLEMGQSPNSDSYNSQREGLPFYQGKTDFGSFVPSPRVWCSSPMKIAESGDVLVSVRAPVGPTNYTNERCCIGRGLAAVRPLGGMHTEFVLWWLRAYETQIAEMGTGTTFTAVSKKNLEPFMIVIPPLSEQNRILDKIKELMNLCDSLETQLALSNSLSTAARRSAVDAISTAQSQDEFETAWNRIQKNWKVVAGTTKAIDSLRDLILSLAVSGELSRQSRTTNESHSLLPRDWELKEFSEVANFSIGKTPPTKETKYWGGDDSIMWVSIGDMQNGGTVLETNRRISPSAQSEIFRRSPWPSGTLLMSFKLTIGKVSRLAVPAFFNEAIFAFDSGNEVTNEFLFRVLPFISQRAESKGAIKGNTLNSQSIRKMLIPIPPVDEQSRLVNIIDQLNQFCDDLESQLSTQVSLAEKFARSIVSQSG